MLDNTQTLSTSQVLRHKRLETGTHQFAPSHHNLEHDGSEIEAKRQIADVIRARYRSLGKSLIQKFLREGLETIQGNLAISH